MKTIIMGAGPAGLSAAYILSRNNKDVVVLEKDNQVGGISKTIRYKNFRFDLGGHRFWTKNEEVNKFIYDLMKDEMIKVPRTSRIYMNNKYFDYPLSPINSLFGMGILNSFHIITDYGFVRIKNLFRKRPDVSFEDWIVNRFGRVMYKLFFKQYTEKVWGIPCTQLSADWAAQRIKGMSLRTALKDAFIKSKNSPKSLIKEFTFPKFGIGRISERLTEEVKKKKNKVELNSEVVEVRHKNNKITSIVYENKGKEKTVKADNYISSIPVSELIFKLNPKAPKKVIEHAKKLGYVNEIFVLIALNKEQVSTDSWIYFPSDDISFVRIHEPKNWSKDMCPNGKTSIVAEYICSSESDMWKVKDEELTNRVINDLVKLGFIKREEVIGFKVVRNQKTYPLYDIGYRENRKVVVDYLRKFSNLQIIGRYGIFRYNNLDHSLEMGIKAAQNLLGANHDIELVGAEQGYLEQKM